MPKVVIRESLFSQKMSEEIIRESLFQKFCVFFTHTHTWDQLIKFLGGTKRRGGMGRKNS